MPPADVNTYGDRFASVYDEWYEHRMDPTDAVDFLAQLAAGGRALELGVGTGRVALPLASRGVEVVGIEASHQMARRLRAKAGSECVQVTIGDFADVAVDGTFSLVYVSFSTLFLLPSQAEQIRCMRNVASHLEPSGCFMVEAFVPDAGRYTGHQQISLEDFAAGSVRIEAARHDPVEQRIEASRIVLTEDGVRIYPYSLRYATPAELDVMAMLAGLELAERYAGYDRRRFDATATGHVSLYRKV